MLEPPCPEETPMQKQPGAVLLRYFTGLTVEETAHVVGESDRTVYRDWRRARAWLARQLADGEPPGDAEEGP